MIITAEERILVQGNHRAPRHVLDREDARLWHTDRRWGASQESGVDHCEVPVFGSAGDAMREVGFDVSVLFIPPLAVRDAALDAIESGARALVVLTEHVPVQDVMYFLSAARANGAQVVGPNTAGTVTPGQCFVGFMPAFSQSIFRPGRVGVISRSGSLGTLICMDVVRAGQGISAFLGIGGDPVIGTTTGDALRTLDESGETDAVVMVGEIGGTMEEDAAEYAQTMRKPVVSFIAGAAAPVGKKMGHAGAIVMGNKGQLCVQACSARARRGACGRYAIGCG